jgi:hypothetical protein
MAGVFLQNDSGAVEGLNARNACFVELLYKRIHLMSWRSHFFYFIENEFFPLELTW